MSSEASEPTDIEWAEDDTGEDEPAETIAVDAPSSATLVASLAQTQARLAIAIAALHRCAAWADAESFNEMEEPRAARIARECLGGIGEKRPEGVKPFAICDECGGFGVGPDRVDGPGDVYQDKCGACGGTGVADAT